MTSTTHTSGSTGVTSEQSAALVVIAAEVERLATQKALGLKGKGSSTVKDLCRQLGRKNASPKTRQETAQTLVGSLMKGNEQAKTLAQKINDALAGNAAAVAADEGDAKLIALANEVQAQAAILGLDGDGQNQAKALSGEMLSPTRMKPIRECADQLAALLKNGNAVAQKFAARIVDILQLKLPLPVSETISAMTASKLETSSSPTDGGEVTDAGDGATASNADQASAPPLDEIVWVNPNALREDPKFSGLFERDQKLIDAITHSLKEADFEVEHAVVATRDGRIVDGTTRWMAAIAAGLSKIPVVYVAFENDEEAIEYAERAQLVRRNLDSSAILRLTELHDQRRQRGGDRRSEEAINASKNVVGRSSQETGAKIGVSSSTVEKARTIIDSGDGELRKKVEAGELSIDAAAKVVRERKKPIKKGSDQLRKESGIKMLRNLKLAADAGRDHWSAEAAQVDAVVNALRVRVDSIPAGTTPKKQAKKVTKVKRTTKAAAHG